MKNIDSKKFLKFGGLIAAVAVVAMVVTGCKDDFTSPANPDGISVTSVVSGDADLTILTAALAKTNQSNNLGNINSGTFTLFAPTDSAFVAYFQGRLGPSPVLTTADVLTYINTTMSTSSVVTFSSLNSVLTYHIISSRLTSAELSGAETFATLNGARLSISKAGSNTYLNANTAANGSKVKTLDATASNGVVHKINRVLVPVATTTAASLVGVAVNYSVTPPVATAAATSGSNYDVFAAAVAKAGVSVASNILPNTSPLPEVTVFAPNDAAFIAYAGPLIPKVGATEADAIAYVKSLDPAALAAILNYHIVASRLLTTDLPSGTVVKTVTGGSFTVNVSGAIITIVDSNGTSADAKIVSANVLTNAGAVHGIDHVLLPQ
jgi:uncharacterized surface protein with fasciclin (FAS1) repeats